VKNLAVASFQACFWTPTALRQWNIILPLGLYQDIFYCYNAKL